MTLANRDSSPPCPAASWTRGLAADSPRAAFFCPRTFFPHAHTRDPQVFPAHRDRLEWSPRIPQAPADMTMSSPRPIAGRTPSRFPAFHASNRLPCGPCETRLAWTSNGDDGACHLTVDMSNQYWAQETLVGSAYDVVRLFGPHVRPFLSFPTGKAG